MDPAMMRDLQRDLEEIKRTRAKPRLGVVATASPLTVKLGASDVPTGASTLVTGLAIGDVVYCLFAGGDLVVIGRVGGLQSQQTSVQTAAAAQSTASPSTYAAMTNGPSIIVPQAGQYSVEAFGSMQTKVAGQSEGRVLIAVNGVASRVVGWLLSTVQFESVVTGSPWVTSLAGGDVLTLLIATSNQSFGLGEVRPWHLAARPIRTT